MATTPDNFTGRLSFFGRVRDELTREVVAPPGGYQVSVRGVPAQAEYKRDGFFAFQGLVVSPAILDFDLTAPLYQGRTFKGSLPTPDPVELTYGGEDEVYLAVKTVNGVAKTVGFDKIPFLPRIAKGAPVIGQGFSTTLAESLEGVDVATASLDSVVGTAPGELLRVVRSRSLVAKPGPYYSFPARTTLAHVKVVRDTPQEEPLGAAELVLQSVNAVAPAGVVVAGVELETVSLAGPPLTLILGTERDLETVSDARGQAVFFFPGEWPITALALAVSAPGHVPKNVTLAVTAKQRTLATVKLSPA